MTRNGSIFFDHDKVTKLLRQMIFRLLPGNVFEAYAVADLLP